MSSRENADHNAVLVGIARAIDLPTATWEQIEELADAALTYVENHHGLRCPGEMCPCSYRGNGAERELIEHYLRSHAAGGRDTWTPSPRCARCDVAIVQVRGQWMHTLDSKPSPCPRACPPSEVGEDKAAPDYSIPGDHHDNACERRSGHEWPLCQCERRAAAKAPAPAPDRALALLRRLVELESLPLDRLRVGTWNDAVAEARALIAEVDA